MKALDITALILVVVGALNWALVGLFGFDLVAFIVGESFGDLNVLNRIIYVAVGIAGAYLATLPTRWEYHPHHHPTTVH